MKQTKWDIATLHGSDPYVAQNSHHKDITKYEQNWHKTKIQYFHKMARRNS